MIVHIPDVGNMEHREAFHLPQTEAASGTTVTGASQHFWFILIVKAMLRIYLL